MNRPLRMTLCVVLTLLVVLLLSWRRDVRAQDSPAATDSAQVLVDSATVLLDSMRALVDSMTTAPDTTVLITADTTRAQERLRTENDFPQDTPENRGFMIRTSDGRARLRIWGSIRVVALYDFNGLQNEDVFNTYDIPTGEANITEPRFALDANQTRFGFEMARTTTSGEAKAFIEGDFLGGTSTFRLRHAYASGRGFTIGQTWTTFADGIAMPLTIDLEGPNSAVSFRTPLIRFTWRGEKSSFTVGLENPQAQVTEPATLDSLDAEAELAFQSQPDVILRLRRNGNWGHVQIAGVFRGITFRDSSKTLQYLPGYGGALSGVLNLGTKTAVLYQAVAGEGISRYISALSGEGLDAVFNPRTQEFEKVSAFGGYFALRRLWTEAVRSHLVLGDVKIEEKSFLPPGSYSNSQYVALNTFWYPTAGTHVGLEYLWGRRQDKDEQTGTANRIQIGWYYDF